jgi:hypothetical protein
MALITHADKTAISSSQTYTVEFTDSQEYPQYQKEKLPSKVEKY